MSLFVAAGGALAQTLVPTPAPEAAERARVHIGGLSLDPRFALRDVGVDTNVFNAATTPTRDVTASFGPVLDSWLRIGRTGLSGRSSVDWNYYRHASTQRAFDAAQSGRLDVDLGWLVPHVAASVERTRQRPNVEIDARALRHTTAWGGGIAARIGSAMRLDLSQEHIRLQYDDQLFSGIDLSELSRQTMRTTGRVEYTLTPLTSAVVQLERRQDRFLTNTVRDADTQAVMPGLVFKPLALVSGSAFVGYRAFTPRALALVPYRGVVSDIDLQWQLRDLTRATVAVQRDIDYSFETVEPYYISTGASAAVTQALGAGWDVVARVGTTQLDYRAVVTATTIPARLDHVDVYGMGIGRRLANDVRIGVDVNHVRRRSNVPERVYSGVRVGGSVTYAFP